MSNADLIKRLLDAPADGLGTENLCIEAAEILQSHEWRTDMENAPRDGEKVVVIVGGDPIITWWDGFWQGYDGPLWGEPTHWKPIDTPPDTQNT